MTETQFRSPGLTEEQIATLTLKNGRHGPECIDPVLAAFSRSWNNWLPDDERQQLNQYIPLLVGTYKGPKLQITRALMALDWTLRIYAPMWLEQVPELARHAAELRALAPITGEIGDAERTDVIKKSNAAARAARAAWASRASRAAEDALAARVALAARNARAARAIRAAGAAWAAWDAWDAGDAWASRDAGDAWDIMNVMNVRNAAASAGTIAAYEAARGSATYEEARARADAVFMAHRDEVQAQLHDLCTRMINAELQ